MKKILFFALALGALASCEKEQETYQPNNDGNNVTVTFVDEPNMPESRSFFDPSAATEVWEKSLTSLSVYAFDASGKLIVQRAFTSTELAAKTATFALPHTAAGKSCDFYAVANLSPASITSKAELLAVTETNAAVYNGTFAKVSSSAARTGGFVMSGFITKTVASGTTDVSIVLKRTVAKVAIQTTLSADFGNRYPGKVKINAAKVSRAAGVSPLFSSGIASGGTPFTFNQPSEAGTANTYKNLIYLFGNGTLAAGSRVMIELDAIYDRDGNFTTTTDQLPITYSFELNGRANGEIQRNGYYRIAVSIGGLSGEDVNTIVTVADWETPVTQNINLGE